MQAVTKEFLESRRQIIGGSDAAAILGLSPFAGPHDVFLSKVGEVEDREPDSRQYWGTKLEASVAEWYVEQKQAAGQNVRLTTAPLLVHPKYPYIGGHVDRFVLNGKPDPVGILEVKTADARRAWLWGKEGDDIPEYYNLQCQHYMMVTGLDWCDVAVLIGGNDARIYHVERHDGIIAVLLRREIEFWNDYVLTRTPPPIDDSESAEKSLRFLYPADSGEVKAADAKIAKVAEDYFDADGKIKIWEGIRQGYRNRLEEFMGSASCLTGPGWKFTWKLSKESAKTDWKAAFDRAYKFLVEQSDALAIQAMDAAVVDCTNTKLGNRVFRPTAPKEDK